MAFRNSVTPRVGPFAFWTSPDNGRHLNPAGTKLIEEYLEQYPNPSTLVNLKYPSFKRVADDILGRDEVRSVCMMALVRSVLVYDDSLSTVQTYSALSMRRDLQFAIDRVRRTSTVSSSEWVESEAFAGPCPASAESLEGDEMAVWRGRVSEVLPVVLSSRCARMLEMRFKGVTLEQIAYRYGITKERVRQIECRSLERIKKVLDSPVYV